MATKRKPETIDLANAKDPKKGKTEERKEAKQVRGDGMITLTAFLAASKGKKKYQQDKPVIKNSLREVNPAFSNTRYAYYAVYDGHGGEFCCEYLQEWLHFNVVNNIAKAWGLPPNPDPYRLKKPTDLIPPVNTTPPPDFATDKQQQAVIRQAISQAFVSTDKTLCALVREGKHGDGSCAVACLVTGNVVWCANTGDSKAVLARMKLVDGKKVLKAVALSKDHSPLLVKERKRIEKKGGTVEDGRVCGRLGVSRSFGDVAVKRKGVVANPDIIKFTMKRNDDRFMVLACDGLWEVFTISDCVEFVQKTLAEQWEKYYEKRRVLITLPDEKKETPLEEVVRKTVACLIKEAVMNRGVKDNTTAVLVMFHSEDDQPEAVAAKAEAKAAGRL